MHSVIFFGFIFFTLLLWLKLFCRSLLQETYTIWDTLFYDSGITGTTATWSNWTGYEPKLVRNSEYCSMTIDTDKTNARMYKQFDTSNNDICIEFDVKQVTSSATNIWATLRNNSVAPLGNVDMTRFSGIGGAINEWVHFKFVVTPINVKVYVNNNSNPYTYNASGVTRIYFQIDNNTSELDYKNFMIYPI